MKISFFTYGRCSITNNWKANYSTMANRLYYVHKSGACYIRGGKEYPLEKGFVYLFPGFKESKFILTDNEGFDHSYFDFAISPLFTLDNILKIDISKDIALKYTLDAIDELFREYEGRKKDIEDIVLKYFENILFLIDRSTPLFKYTDERIMKSIEYIHTNYGKNIEVSQIAEDVYLEKSHFIKVFKKQIGLTPYQYIKAYRAEKARRLIEDGMSVGQAAQMVGYSDMPAFSNMIKKTLGFYPSDFKNK